MTYKQKNGLPGIFWKMRCIPAYFQVQTVSFRGDNVWYDHLAATRWFCELSGVMWVWFWDKKLTSDEWDIDFALHQVSSCDFLLMFLHSCLIDISWPSIFAWRLRSTVEVYQWEEQKSEKKSKDSIGHMAIGTYELLRVGSDYYMASGDVIFFETSWEWFEYPQIWGKCWGKLYAKSKVPTVGWYDGMKQFQYTEVFQIAHSMGIPILPETHSSPLKNGGNGKLLSFWVCQG